MSFQQMGLAPEILRVLEECGYEQPSPIQKQAIPAVMTGRDIIACAQTGTGKTAAFTLPLIHHLREQKAANGKARASVLVLTPTRELALQVGESVRTYAKYLNVRSTIIYGGVNINTQIQHLRAGVDVLVATPGRLLDHMQQRTVDLTGIKVLVLDEADRMLDMGFIRDVRKIIASLPKERQSLLFSATFSREIKALACELLKTPTVIEVASRTAAADSVEQCVHPVDRARKRALLSMLIRNNDWRQVLVFTRTKHGANRLAKQLEQDGLSATAIHGNKSQAARVLALKQFKSGDVRILVATDIAARGIDITQLPFVVNYDLPNVPEDYVHRIGRTGRAGCEGKAVSLVSADEQKLLEAIERLLKHKIPSVLIPNFGAESASQLEHEEAYEDRPQRSMRPNQQRSHSPQQHRDNRNAGNQRSGNQRSGNQRSGNQRSDNQRSDNQRSNSQRSNSPRNYQANDGPSAANNSKQRDEVGNRAPGQTGGNSLRKADDRNSANNRSGSNRPRHSSSHDRHAINAGNRFFNKISKKLADDEQDDDGKDTVNSKSTTVQAPTRRRWFFL